LSSTRRLELMKKIMASLQFRSAPRYEPDAQPPLRSELLSADQIEQYGKRLAASHKLMTAHVRDPLLARLTANEAVLVEVCNLLSIAVSANHRITPAGEWLLDNFYLIEEQIRTARQHFPKGYSRELPRLAIGPSSGLPRVYDIALETISHGDGRVDPESLNRFVASYQTVTTLKLGELWAIPIMLRLALIENLRRVAVRIAAGRIERNMAGDWADQMFEIVETDPKNLVLVIADMARSNPPMTTPFVSEFARRLQGHSAALALPLNWVEQHLAESGRTIEQLVQSGNQQQAADQVSISNTIGSLRFLATMDWRSFVEIQSGVEHLLMQDPHGTYADMEFATRDCYRHVIEKLAKKSAHSEIDLAKRSLEFAREGAIRNGQHDRTAHVGYYLIDKGLSTLEQAAEVRHPALHVFSRIAKKNPMFMYIGPIILFTLFLTAFLLAYANARGFTDWIMLPLGLLLLLATSQLSVALVNWLASLLTSPYPLPRLDFSTGIPAQWRTLVVVPTLLSSTEHIDALVEALEVRFLANRDTHLHFALLTDFCDAAEASMPEDSALLEGVTSRIEALNTKYRDTHDSAFFLFHRPRVWNAHDHLWMGYERKRGKLSDLNAFLRNGSTAPFFLIVGNTEALTGTQYVITLDNDTQLPRDAARQFVGALAHPLNRAHYDTNRQRVTAGYGILQPRVDTSLAVTSASLYARLHSGTPGIDPYTRVVSDVYQDVFGEGSFIGKGIYDIDAFEQALGGRFPENRILSHDLLEGCYARAGLLSDGQLYEDYPAQYNADVRRRHRWIRGDWQLAGWLLPRVPGPDARRQKNPLSHLSRWKLLDNLRRSLVPAGLTSLLILGWLLLSLDWLMNVTVLGVLFIPPLIASLLEVLKKASDVLWRQHALSLARATGQRLAYAFLSLVTLPYEAYYSLDAILRTVWRMVFSHRRLLEWQPSGAQTDAGLSLGASYRTMWIAPALVLLITLALLWLKPGTLLVAAPILLLWLASPAITWWISRPLARREAQLTPAQIRFLNITARKTWNFFDTFVNAEENWLPPDNYQDFRGARVAHRTSPTNIGLSLLSNLSAYDFGYIPGESVLERTAHTFATLDKLERYRGHFFNWYDTLSLQPLHPRYVSTVDSGNLVGHLLTLRQGLLGLENDSIFSPRGFDALRDTLAVALDAAGIEEGVDPVTPALSQLQQHLALCCITRADTLAAVALSLRHAVQYAQDWLSSLAAEAEKEVHFWAQKLVEQAQHAHDALIFQAPWLELPHLSALESNHIAALNVMPTLRELAHCGSAWSDTLAPSDTSTNDSPARAGVRALMLLASERAQARIAEIDVLARQAEEFAQMEFEFLYARQPRLLTIGFNVDEMRRDSGFYDLLASEARLCSFVTIAQDQLPQESWFALGRQLTRAGGDPILLSWSGSMFEYLMPLLVMPTFDHTLLDQTFKAAVTRQIAYGKQLGLPWGMSESGYNLVDANFNYQYRAFGVPGLGLKRGLAADIVIAPYASALALMVSPEAACANLQRLAAEGLTGRHGFYEAVDYTVSRQRRGEVRTILHSYMAHHHGMSLLSLAYLLLNRPMQRRFEADPLFQATMLLLQERIPKATVLHLPSNELAEIRVAAGPTEISMRVLTNPHTAVPEVQLLSNGRYHVMVSNAGGGYSRWKDLAVTRWREDATRDHWGSFCYLRDVVSGEFWSTAYQPTLTQAKHYEAIFSGGRAEFRRRDNDIETHTEIVVSPEDDIELRRVRLINHSRVTRTLDVTSYTEVVLAAADADAMHPAFSNLFVQTEIVREQRTILCTRRPRSVDEVPPWMFHIMAVHGAEFDVGSYETDRLRFIGRGHSVADPEAMTTSTTLSGGEGSVLDPIAAIRHTITLEPGQSATIDMVIGMAEQRDQALNLAGKYHDQRLADRVFELAWTHSQVVLRQINANESDAQLYSQLASSVLYAHSALRTNASVVAQNRRGQSGLWGYAISGDLPIVLLQIGDLAHIELVRQMVQALAYWRLKGLEVDLVIWNEDRAGYRQLLQEQILGLVAAGVESNVIGRPGGIFVRPTDQISSEDRILLQAVARVIITDNRGSLEEQIKRRSLAEKRIAPLVPTKTYRTQPSVLPAHKLILDNGLGGFSPDGREYVITTAADRVTPAPWVNVLANPNFGSVISENGLAYSWGENAHEFRLTPWYNDPVTDASGEAYYLRDEETGHYWSPTPLPCRGAGEYVSRHGFGYSVFEHIEDGIHSSLTVFVALDASIKFSVLKLRNDSGRARFLSASGYVEWVLGDLRPKSTMHVITDLDLNSGALMARNPYNTEFAGRVAFFDVDDVSRTVSGDRTEFIGRNGNLSRPAAMTRSHLSGKIGACLDPCGALQLKLDLADGEEREITFRLGLGHDANDAARLAQRFRGNTVAHATLDAVDQYWRRNLGAVQVETPDAALNVLANGWLLYQIVACRLWARSGYYQSGGAFGFRDQLQDVMALVHAEPQRLRSQLLLCAALVAPTFGARRAHALFGRLFVAAVGDLPLCADDR
jgi:cyclic beta-1,2-glucan synthetase